MKNFSKILNSQQMKLPKIERQNHPKEAWYFHCTEV